MTVREATGGKLYDLRCRTLNERTTWREKINAAIGRAVPLDSAASSEESEKGHAAQQRRRSVKAVAPPGSQPGSTVVVMVQGQKFKASVPRGVSSGEEFVINLPPETETTSKYKGEDGNAGLTSVGGSFSDQTVGSGGDGLPHSQLMGQPACLGSSTDALLSKSADAESSDSLQTFDGQPPGRQRAATALGSEKMLHEFLENSNLRMVLGRLNSVGVHTLNDLVASRDCGNSAFLASSLDLSLGEVERFELVRCMARDALGLYELEEPIQMGTPRAHSIVIDVQQPLGFSFDGRLQVTSISPQGQFGASGVSIGSIVVSLAGKDLFSVTEFKQCLMACKEQIRQTFEIVLTHPQVVENGNVSSNDEEENDIVVQGSGLEGSGGGELIFV